VERERGRLRRGTGGGGWKGGRGREGCEGRGGGGWKGGK